MQRHTESSTFSSSGRHGSSPLHRQETLVYLTIGSLLVAVTFLHYATSTRLSHLHDLYRVLYFLPIILGAMKFGLRGGVTTSLAVTALYLPHVFLQWGGIALENVARFLMLVLYNVVGTVTGYLATRERQERQRYQQAAEQLAAAYEQLKRSTDRLAEVEAQLMHMDRLAVLGEMAASLAHEVRNPLGAIRGAAEILGGERVNEETRRRFTSLILNEVGRLNNVVERYLGISRQRTASWHTIDLRSAVELVAEVARPHARRKRVSIQTQLPSSPVTQMVDPTALQQLLLNLVLNAISASPEGESVVIRVVAREEGCVIHVVDQGPGIPEELSEKIWAPFFTTRSNGTGLGLSIARRIAKQMGWTLSWVNNPDRGATFTVVIGESHGEVHSAGGR